MAMNKDINTSKDMVLRDQTWDAIKGIAILLMVVGHSGCPYYLRNFIYLFHMGLFYYASGHFFKPCGIDGILPFLKKKIVGLYLPFLMWGGIYVLLHNSFYSFGWYTDAYSLGFLIKKLVMTVLFKDVENLLAPLWFLQSLFKGLTLTYIVCLIPKKWLQWVLVIMLYLIGWICYEKGVHLFYSMNRDMGIVIAIFLGYELKKNSFLQAKWWIMAFVVLLLSSCFCVRIDLVGGGLGQLGMFPILTLAGFIFIRGFMYICQQKLDFCYKIFVWLGRNSLYILILHFTGFHLLSEMMLYFGVGNSDSLSNLTILNGINNSAWFIPYTLSGLLLPFVYLNLRNYYKRYSIF